MSRTNIDIDDDLIQCVMQRYNLRTKREAVDFALRQIAPKPLTREEFLAFEGIGLGTAISTQIRIKYSPVRRVVILVDIVGVDRVPAGDGAARST